MKKVQSKELVGAVNLWAGNKSLSVGVAERENFLLSREIGGCFPYIHNAPMKDQ